MFNTFVLQTLTWICSVSLCIICMFQSMIAARIALIFLLLSRAMIAAGNQSVIATV